MDTIQYYDHKIQQLKDDRDRIKTQRDTACFFLGIILFAAAAFIVERFIG